jgi:hypothetical protein
MISRRNFQGSPSTHLLSTHKIKNGPEELCEADLTSWICRAQWFVTDLHLSVLKKKSSVVNTDSLLDENVVHRARRNFRQRFIETVIF